MSTKHPVTAGRIGLALVLVLSLSGCVGAPGADEALDVFAAKDFGPAQECLARAMYFESNRSSEDGMLAVGTVVMNRVSSTDYPNEVCDVVGQPRQFAPGVMTRSMGAGKDLAMKTAYRVLTGERHKAVDKAKFFHTAGMNFPYRNMSYRLIAGGNAFYEKVSRRLDPSARIVSQAEIRQAQNAGGAIDLMRTASTRSENPRNATSAIGYAEARAPAPSAAAVPGERPAAGDATDIATKSPFLAMFKDRPDATDKPGKDRGSRLVNAGRADETNETAAASDLPGVEATSIAASNDASAKTDGAAWLARW